MAPKKRRGARRHSERARVDTASLDVCYAVVEAAPAGLAIVDTSGTLVFVNRETERLFGYSRDELVGRSVEMLVPARFRGHHPAMQAGFLATPQARAMGAGRDLRGLCRDGTEIPVEIGLNPIESHGVQFVVASIVNITERKRAEAALKREQDALRRSEDQYRALVDGVKDVIFALSADAAVTALNPAFEEVTGWARDEWLGKPFVGLLHPDDVAEARDLIGIVLRGESRGAVRLRVRKRGGEYLIGEFRANVRRRDGEAADIYGIVRDITDQVRLEEQFRQAQKMEAVGRLAGGVAHDFNNILTAITGYSDLLLEDLAANDRKRGDVEEIKAAAGRATGLTRQLLAFSRKLVFQSRVLDLNEVVQTLDKMLHRLIGEDVEFAVALASGLGAVRADPGQLEQVILNLTINARDAMPSGGRLTIETANVTLDEVYAREHQGASPGRYVMLAVSDTGIGMDEATRSHIFEPFFTTKELGRGTGLGLSTVYGIIKQSGGYVWVYSEPGRGATFKIYLPEVDERPEDLNPATPEPVAGGGETVLLAEDDPSVRAVASDVLSQKGYRVLRAADGQAALQLAQGQAGKIHLLVTDLVMPGMTGRELADALMVERPDLRVLYMSGYTDDTVVRHRVLEEGMPYLQKPFTARSLASKVREVLDRAVI